MRIDTADERTIRRVALNMRDSDFAEFSAVSFADNRRALADMLAEQYGKRHMLCAWHDGKPVWVGGAVQLRPRVFSLLFFSTDDLPKIGVASTLFIKRRLFPQYFRAGAHRLEAVSLATHTEAHRWLEFLGLRAETGLLEAFGKNRENFIQFSKVVDVRPAGA